MNKIRIALSTALAASGLVGTQILTTDEWLWYAAPTHAYGLIAFVAIDVLLIAALWRGTRLAETGAVSLAVIQLLAMAGDLAGFSPVGVSSGVFRNYLLSNSSFMALLYIQPVVAGLAIFARRMRGPIDPNKYAGAYKKGPRPGGAK